ncbi:MAG: hypothetical protein ABJC33_09210, partial [Betaproteobacteria bacterium]
MAYLLLENHSTRGQLATPAWSSHLKRRPGHFASWSQEGFRVPSQLLKTQVNHMTHALEAFRKVFRQLLTLALLATAGGAGATSTDGYHTIQVVPVSVLSGSFATSLFIHNSNASPVNVNVTYYPGTNYDPLLVTAPSPVACGIKVIAAGRVAQFANLTALCPGALSGFGWIWAEEVTANSIGPHRPFNIFTRIDNIAGTAGFEAEAYPPHTFTGTSYVWITGLRRLAGGGGVAPKQTNCFTAALNEATTIQMTALDGSTGAVIAGPLNVAPRQMFRFLDVFSVLGDLTGGADVSNAVLRVSTAANGAAAFPGSIVFCTVQNNTTLDADFRIAKASPVFDNHVQRLQGQIVDEAGIPFALGNYPNERNRHVVYFKHPD